MNDTNPDYVVCGETRNYSYEKIELGMKNYKCSKLLVCFIQNAIKSICFHCISAVHLVLKGARLIGTNCDVRDRMNESFVPACGALIKPIELATGREPYVCLIILFLVICILYCLLLHIFTFFV